MSELKFSDRIGVTKPKSIIQIDSMDDDFKNGLWSILYIDPEENYMEQMIKQK